MSRGANRHLRRHFESYSIPYPMQMIAWLAGGAPGLGGDEDTVRAAWAMARLEVESYSPGFAEDPTMSAMSLEDFAAHVSYLARNGFLDHMIQREIEEKGVAPYGTPAVVNTADGEFRRRGFDVSKGEFLSGDES